MTLNLMFNDHVNGYVVFLPEKNKNYNLLLAKRKILIIFITYEVYGSRSLLKT